MPLPSASPGVVVFAGAATLDVITLVTRFPEPNERQVAEDLIHAGGGPAATAAVAAARLGQPAAFVGTVGDDAEGERIIEGLRAEGVDVAGVHVASGGRSGASVVVVDRGRGTRMISARPAPPPDIRADSPAAALIQQAQWVHTDHVGWGPVAAFRHGQQPGQRRPWLSVDAGNPIPDFRPADVDLYAPTVEALTHAYGDRARAELIDAALADGARWVVATDGANSTVAGTETGQRYTAPVHRVAALSTLGAGDVFHGALVTAIVRGMPPQACLSYANIVAGLSCRCLDGRSAIPSDAEARTHLPDRAAAGHDSWETSAPQQRAGTGMTYGSSTRKERA